MARKKLTEVRRYRYVLMSNEGFFVFENTKDDMLDNIEFLKEHGNILLGVHGVRGCFISERNENGELV